MSYNLLVEPWIPVLWRDGTCGRLGLREVLAQAERIRGIAASSPMDRVAVLRFLLAVLYWSRGSPSGEKVADPCRWPTAEAFGKLDEHAPCFDLLGDGPRFYQYRRAEPGTDAKLTANYLLQEVPTGTNAWHFRHATDKVDGLCPACCALGLLRLPLFATSGGRGKPPGVNSKPPIYAVPVGASLAETLLLSWRPTRDLGTPAWVKPDQQLPKTGPVPLLTGLTWVPRRVWLDNPSEPVASCLSCGHTGPLIRLTAFAPIGSTKVEEGSARLWRDPHVLYVTSAKGEVTSLHAADAVGSRDAAAWQWTRLVASALVQPEPSRAALWVVGFATVQNDKYLEATECMLPASRTPDDLLAALDRLARWQKEAARLPRALSRSKALGTAAAAALRPHAESRAFANLDGLLSGEETVLDGVAAAYDPLLQAAAGALAPGCTTAALLRRRQITSARPDLRPRPAALAKPRRQKGEAS